MYSMYFSMLFGIQLIFWPLVTVDVPSADIIVLT